MTPAAVSALAAPANTVYELDPEWPLTVPAVQCSGGAGARSEEQ
jgi:hypothetical protein